MTLKQHQRKYAVGNLTNRLVVQQAIEALEKADFSSKRIYIIAQESQRNDRTETEIKSSNYGSKGLKKGALTGIVVGGITGILVGTGAVAIPMVGPIMLAEAMTTAVVTTLAGSGMGVFTGGILGSLIGLSIPKKKESFSAQEWQGNYLVGIEGTEEELHLVNSILSKKGIEPWKIYNSWEQRNFAPAITQTAQPQLI